MKVWLEVPDALAEQLAGRGRNVSCAALEAPVRRVDEASYMLRLTPRRPRSNWTDANLRRVEELRAAGRLRPGGERAVSEARAAARRSQR